MSEYTSFPLSWPLSWKRTTFRTHSRFGRRNPPTVAQGRDGVIDELRKMKVWDWEVVISTNIPLRRDGLPYSNQKEPSDPGVAVYFKVNKKPTVLACDKWNTVGDNLGRSQNTSRRCAVKIAGVSARLSRRSLATSRLRKKRKHRAGRFSAYLNP